MKWFQIGDICFSRRGYPIPQRPDGYYGLFRVSGEAALSGEKVCYNCVTVPLEPYGAGVPVVKTPGYSLYDTEEGELLVYSWRGAPRFAVKRGQMNSPGDVTCMLPPTTEGLPAFGQFFAMAGIQSKFLWLGGMVFHAACIGWQGQAVLFAAPSQTGKSTQAELWREHMGAGIINGDRILLRKRGGRWYAHGYPMCGSSDICVNVSLPLRAVVLLEQGEKNRVEPVELARRVQSLAAGAAFFAWDRQQVDRALALAGELARAVPVCRLICRPDRDAVETLRRYLEGNT